jgi:hypothetical protein
MCGAKFDWYDRSDKKFCDQNCRKRWSRRKQSIKKEYANVMGALTTLRMIAKEHDDLRPYVMEQLRQLRGALNDVLRMYDREEQLEQARRDEMIGTFQQRREMTGR